MKKVSDLVQQPGQTSSTPQTGKTRLNIPDEHKRFVNQIFERIIAKRTAWRQAVAGDEEEWAGSYKRELYAALVKVGVRDVDTINRAFSLMEAEPSDFLPGADRVAQYFKDARQLIDHEESLRRPRISEKPASRDVARYQFGLLRKNRNPARYRT